MGGGAGAGAGGLSLAAAVAHRTVRPGRPIASAANLTTASPVFPPIQSASVAWLASYVLLKAAFANRCFLFASQVDLLHLLTPT